MLAILRWQHKNICHHITITNRQRDIIELYKEAQENNEKRIHELESELEYRKKLVDVSIYDDDPEKRAEAVGRLVREIAGHKQ